MPHWKLKIENWTLAFLACAIVSVSSFAQTTTPAPAAPDRSTPKAALASLLTAMRAGDYPAAAACLHFKDARQAELFSLSFSQTCSPLRLMNAMQTRFGDAGLKPFANITITKTIDTNLERLKSTDFAIDGDSASVDQKKANINPSAENELTGIRFHRENGHWLVVASTFSDAASDLPENQVERLRPLQKAVETAVNDTTPRVAAGQFQSPAEAYAHYQAQLQSTNQSAQNK